MVLDTRNIEGDQLSQIQGHLALTVWMLPYEVVSCLDEDDSVLLEPLSALYLERILFQCFKNDFESLTRLSFSCPSAYVVHVHWTYSNIQSIL